MTATRRLAAILAADVAGYSRLMGADEEGTHERLKAHHRELVDPKISEHSGTLRRRARNAAAAATARAPPAAATCRGSPSGSGCAPLPGVWPNSVN
jgi:class 3 adenylate cyclase